MSNDEKAIRGVIETWLSASERGDVETVLGLMSDDVVFLVAGQPPFGKEAFAASFRAMVAKGVRMAANSDVQELAIAGDWAWCRTELRVTVTPPAGAPMQRAGQTLTIFRRTNDTWVIARDANLLTTV
jgi:uncharacterized protein (TIGR02246 family)